MNQNLTRDLDIDSNQHKESRRIWSKRLLSTRIDRITASIRTDACSVGHGTPLSFSTHVFFDLTFSIRSSFSMAIRSETGSPGLMVGFGLFFLGCSSLATGFTFVDRVFEAFVGLVFVLATLGADIDSFVTLVAAGFGKDGFRFGFFLPIESVPIESAGARGETKSIPKSDPRSSSAMVEFLFLDDWVLVKESFNWELDTTSDTSSLFSTPRSKNRSSGLVSSRFPIPNMTAAKCLHKDAESGQLHRMRISFGCGNSPTLGAVKHFITESLNLPRSKSMMEWMD